MHNFMMSLLNSPPLHKSLSRHRRAMEKWVTEGS
jgi:hypothetical protein